MAMLSYAATSGKPDSPGTAPILNLRFKSMVGNGIPEIHFTFSSMVPSPSADGHRPISPSPNAPTAATLP